MLDEHFSFHTARWSSSAACVPDSLANTSAAIILRLYAYSALFDHGLASKFDQRFASIRSTGNLTFSTAF
ncbi:hypothetical protein E2Q88_27080 [Escherichia coli]|nr:hypothetical protein [Escherichia coli]